MLISQNSKNRLSVQRINHQLLVVRLKLVFLFFYLFVNHMQVTALVVIAIGVLFAVYFYVCVQEEQANKLPKLKWYKRFLDIRFYLVCAFCVAANNMHGVTTCTLMNRSYINSKIVW